MRGLVPACAGVVLLLVSAPVHAESFVAVPVRVEPPGGVRAVALNAGGAVYACEVRDGQLLVPKKAPLPWTVAQLRFEPAVYTARDLQMKVPLVLRALGELHVRFCPSPRATDSIRGLLLRNGEQKPSELSLSRDRESFRAPLASGTYAGAFFTDTRGTRIRSGIVIAPGQTTEIGDLSLEPTGSVTLRVVDGKNKRPVSGAKVTWSPPAALNSEVARHLFSRAWSANTDRAGMVAFRAIGPPPVPVRWAVEARGYASMMTPQVLIGDTERVVVPDTPLRPETVIIVEFLPPRDADAFEGASLVVSEPENDESLRYTPFLRQRLREGENKVKTSRFGRMRFSIESKEGTKLLYVDREISADGDRLAIAPTPTEVHGVVKRQDLPVEGVVVVVADRRDGTVIVGQATTDRSGRYAMSTFQGGDVRAYTIGPHESRASAASTLAATVSKAFRLAGEREVRVDFQLPNSGATVVVVDAESRAPIRARVQGSMTEKKRDRTRGVFLETDERGTAKIVGAPEAKAKVFVRAKGYRGREVALDVGYDLPAVTVELTPAGVITGRVLDRAGTPVAHAHILGGFPHPITMQGHFQTSTDSSGRFEVEGGPDPETPFYVVASGYALAVTNLREDTENVIRLAPPNAGALRVVSGHGPPTTLPYIVAAPKGGAVIPSGVFQTLGEVNGLSPYQLNSTAKDGTLILPEFLAPGSYSLYRVRSTGKPLERAFDHITDLRVPAPAGSIITIPD